MAGTAAGGSRRSRLAPYLLVAPGVLWLLVFFVAPIVTLAQTSVAGEGPGDGKDVGEWPWRPSR